MADETQVMVQEGQMLATAVDQTITLVPNQRAQLISLQPPIGPLVPQENLIVNGNFPPAPALAGGGLAKNSLEY